jgi:hypothetical protein
VEEAGFIGTVLDAGGGVIGAVDDTEVIGAGVEALPGTGGWKRRADLRSSGSTGGVMALDFRAGSGSPEPVAGLTSAGGIVMEADLRMIGSTGGTIGVDFFTASGGIAAIAAGMAIVGAGGGVVNDAGVRGGGGGVMAAVLPGIIGSEAVTEVAGGAMTPERRINGVTGGRAVDVMAVGAGGADEMGGGTLGIVGGLADRMGDDFATGSGKFGPEGWVTPTGGVTWGADVSEMEGRGGGTSGGCGASGSGTRAVGFVSIDGIVGNGGIGVRAVSLMAGARLGMPTVSLVIMGSVPVAGSAGGRLPCSTGPTSESASVLPLTKTLAAGLAMMTRGGAS